MGDLQGPWLSCKCCVVGVGVGTLRGHWVDARHRLGPIPDATVEKPMPQDTAGPGEVAEVPRGQRKTCLEFMLKKEWKPARQARKEMAERDWPGTGPCNAT